MRKRSKVGLRLLLVSLFSFSIILLHAPSVLAVGYQSDDVYYKIGNKEKAVYQSPVFSP